MPLVTGGSPLTGWKIFESTDGVTWNYNAPSATSNNPALLTYTRNGCTFGSNFWFRFRALSGVGDGDLSDYIRVRCSSAPDTAAAPTLITSTKESVEIGFTYGNLATLNNAVLQGYILSVDDGNAGPFVTTTVSDVTASRYNFTSLVTSLPYRFMVQVVSDAGVSTASPASQFYAASRADALPGTALTVASSTALSLTFSWTLPLGYDNGGAAVSKWLVWATDDRNTDTWQAESGLTEASASIATTGGAIYTGTFTCPAANTYYYFKIAALTNAGVG